MKTNDDQTAFFEIQNRLSAIEQELELVKKRNVRVELDKAWETSIARQVLIIALTYLITATVFHLIGVEQFLKNAFIPTTGFYLSTLSLPFAKKAWLRRGGNDQ